ncbi:MAG: hypothetical protein V2J14_06625 [Erythrobacter sp.]|nr:hypothetical protein [Erythrobacter sp.]
MDTSDTRRSKGWQAWLATAVALAILTGTVAQARKPGMAFWSLPKAQQCEVVRAWTGQVTSRFMQSAMRDLPAPVSFPEILFRFHGERFSGYFGKTYAQLTKAEKKKLASFLPKCSARTGFMAGVSLAFDTSSDRRTETTRAAIRESIAKANAPSVIARVAKVEQKQANAASKEKVFEEQFKGKNFVYDDGKLFFENNELKLFWPHTVDNLVDGPCRGNPVVDVALKKGTDYKVTRENLGAIHKQYVAPAVLSQCPALRNASVELRTHILGTYLDYMGVAKTKERLRYGADAGYLAAISLPLDIRKVDTDPSALRYGVYRSRSDPQRSESEIFRYFSSVDGVQAYIRNGWKTDSDLGRDRQQAAFAAANPDWPFKVPDQDRYVLAGNFRGLTAGSFKNSKPFPNLRLVVAYLEAYSAQCAARSRLATRDLIVTRNVRTGQSTMYLPFKNAPTLLTQQEYEKETAFFAKVREDQIPLVQAIEKWGGTGAWPAFRISESNSPEAKLQRDRVARMGCDTQAMRAYEAKLGAFAKAVNAL